MYDWSDTHGATPKTSAPSRDAAAELLKPYVDEGREVVCFSISGEMSASGNVMRMAAEDLGEMKLVRIVDSANLSTGIGHLVIEAAIMAKDGMDADTIVGRIEELKPRVRASFVVDILTFLYRGGRCSGLAAMAGGVLRLHPKILMEDGKMRPGKKDRVFITHSGCDRELVEAVRAYLISLNHFD